jgi:flagella synthesis protein FlgN
LTHPLRSELLAALTEERQAVRGFVALLQDEQALLTENSIEPLATLAESKSAHAFRLNTLAETRHRLLLGCIPQLTAAAIVDWLQKNSPDGLRIWQEILTLSDQARQLNRINGELIQMKLRHNQQVLTALSRAVNQADLYGSDGQANFSVGSGRSLGSV